MEYKIEPEDIREVISLSIKGEKIKAIKLVRSESGAGLREAKEFVEYVNQEYVPGEDRPFYNIKIRDDVWNLTAHTLSDLLDAWNKASEIHMDLKKRGLM